jgi:chaperonin cofactor prefoldin
VDKPELLLESSNSKYAQQREKEREEVKQRLDSLGASQSQIEGRIQQLVGEIGEMRTQQKRAGEAGIGDLETVKQ